MIVTKIKDLARYKGLGTHLDTAIDWLLKGSWEHHEGDGRVDIDGDNVFALYQLYQSKLPENVRFEAHDVYIDIQLLVSGEEEIHVQNRHELEIEQPYAFDVEFQKIPSYYTAHVCVLTPHVAAILFPEDAHRPGIRHNGKAVSCRKVVLKVKI